MGNNKKIVAVISAGLYELERTIYAFSWVSQALRVMTN
jgi:hypothetical protein